ncbi:MAG: NUDIX hydrolase [Dehalococcoidia bacterium]
MPKETRKAVSAGGVVYRAGDHGVEIVLCGRRVDDFWALPKGTPEPGESLEHTALREVEEETGLQVAIREKVGDIRYQFTGNDGTRYDKRVEHHLMQPTGGHFEHHDGEYDDVGWFPVEEALRLLRYPNEREVVRSAMRLIQRQERS